MSVFNELLPKINEISKAFIKNFNDDLKIALDNIDKFEEEYLNGKGKARDKTLKEKNPMTTLQSIHEDEDETTKSDSGVERQTSSSKSVTESTGKSSLESNPDQPKRASKKRNKNEVDDIFSPEQDKRLKRNASVKAQSIISKQVNVNLTQKLRRENSTEKSDKPQAARNRRRKDEEEKENVPVIQIKQEKISLPPDSAVMEFESLPLDVAVKQEPDKDEFAMPPPAAPVPKPRKAQAKEKAKEDDSSEDEGARRRNTRTRKHTDTTAPPTASARSTRASSRASSRADPPADARPKRTRTKKKPTEPPVNDEVEKETQSSVLSGIESSAEKPRPKRTRKVQKAVENEDPKPKEVQPEPIISPKEERVSEPEIKSPILVLKDKKNQAKDKQKLDKEKSDLELRKREIEREKEVENEVEETEVDAADHGHVMNETRVVEKSVVAHVGEMDKTVVLPNGVYNNTAAHKTMNMNETVVLDSAPAAPALMDATVVIQKDADPKSVDITDDNSLLTDDSDSAPHTPPTHHHNLQPTSAVKEKVQQFEELASRVTRTKTRAMAKKEEPAETQTPPDKIVKTGLSADTLQKMNSMIFNGKPPQMSGTGTKARAPPSATKAGALPSASAPTPASATKLSTHAHDKEDARRKKEAMLDAKRELQRKKREEKMAAAAAAREAAERGRRAAHSAAERERTQRQAQLDNGRKDRQRDLERKKQELARKVAETEERRRAEELARQQRLAEEHRRAEAARRKQLEEAEAIKKEAAMMAKEIERRQREYMEKQKMKNRLEDKTHTPLKAGGAAGAGGASAGMAPVYMCDGFQYLNSDSDSEPAERPVPAWSTSKSRRAQLHVQSLVGAAHVDRLFSVRVHSPDLRAIFPDIERARLKRTSSAVWRTPPQRLHTLHE